MYEYVLSTGLEHIRHPRINTHTAMHLRTGMIDFHHVRVCVTRKQVYACKQNKTHLTILPDHFEAHIFGIERQDCHKLRAKTCMITLC